MPVYRITPTAIEPLKETTFQAQGLKERGDLQRLLRENIKVVDPDVLIIAEEFGEWDDSRRRIDLLGVDTNGNLVVIELKRDADAHMELQALRYAAMISKMTFGRAVDVFQRYLNASSTGKVAERTLLQFLGWDSPREDEFGRDVRITLVSADFSKELMTSVLWLNERQLDIRCVRLKPYQNGDHTIVDAQQVVPLPEAEEYMIRVREKAATVRDSSRDTGVDTGFWFMNCGDGSNEGRAWEDCKRYNFISAGGGERWIAAAESLNPGDRLFAYLSGHGYVGCGIVTAKAVPFNQFVPPGFDRPLRELDTAAVIQSDRMSKPDEWDVCLAMHWVRALDRDEAVLKNRARIKTLSPIRQPDLVSELLGAMGLTEADVTLPQT